MYNKLKGVIEAMIKGGWLEEELSQWDGYDITIYTRYIVMECYRAHADKPNEYDKYRFSLPDLIMNPSAISAITGEEKVCQWCGNKWKTSGHAEFCSKFDCQNSTGNYTGYSIPAHIYHMQQLAEICGESKPEVRDEKVINYLNDLVMEKEHVNNKKI